MRRRFLMFLLAVGTVVGYGSGFAHIAHNRWARMHGYQGDCGSWGRDRWNDNDGYGSQWNRPPPLQQQAPVVQQQPAPQPQVIIVQQPAATPQPQQTPVIVVQPQTVPQQVVVPQTQAPAGSSEQTR